MNDKTREAIRKHGLQLLGIFPNATEREPVELCRRLRRLEGEASRLALRGCNGPEWPGGEDEEGRHYAKVLGKLDALLGFIASGVPVFINRDPRGYALKIDDEWMREHRPALHSDWGGYGILAPEIK